MSDPADLSDQPPVPGTAPDERAFSGKLRAPGPDPVRLGIVVGVALLIVIGAGLTMGASSAPWTSGAGSARPDASPVPSSAPGGQGGPGFGWPGRGFGQDGGFGRNGGGLGGPGFGWMAPFGPAAGGPRFGHGAERGGFGFRRITITAIDGPNVSLKTDDGWTRTIALTSSTTIMKGGQTASLADLKVGDEVRFSETRNSDGTFTIGEIDVVLPHVFGQVTGKSASTITVQSRDGTTATIHVAGATTYRVLGVANGSLSDISVGMFVAAEGTRRSDGSLDATVVLAGNPRPRFHGGPAIPNPSASPGSQG